MIEKFLQRTPTEVEVIRFTGEKENIEEIEKSFIIPII